MASTKVKRRKIQWKTLVKVFDKNRNEKIDVYEFPTRTFKEKQNKPSGY